MTPPLEESVRWEGAMAEEWRRRWALPELLLFDVIGSTNDAVERRVAAGAAAGTVALADHQTAGRGRMGRGWTAPPGRALLLSVLLRPVPSADPAIGAIPLRIGLAAARAIEHAAGVRVRVKWPNDLVSPDGDKLGGILCESRTPGVVVAGLGINVNQGPDELPAGASSLRLLAGGEVSRAAVAGALLRELAPLVEAPADPLSDGERAELAGRDHLHGRPVTLDGRPAGTADGVAPDGSLTIRGDAGPFAVRAGTVRLDPSHTPAAEP